jgi:ketosteroid isomerase-like protein
MMKTFNGVAATGLLIVAACLASAQKSTDLEIKRAYKNLIDAENRHDLAAVKGMVWDSPSALFVAKAPVGWRGYWGIDDVMQHLHDMYQQPFRIDPIYEEEKVAFITPDVAETYAPVKITVAYGGQNPAPKPFIMVLLWVRTPKGWKMTTDIPIPVPPDPAPATARVKAGN